MYTNTKHVYLFIHTDTNDVMTYSGSQVPARDLFSDGGNTLLTTLMWV